MNYSQNYHDYISYVKTLDRKVGVRGSSGYIYYERHHITPRCLGGSDSLDNLVLLTAREHFLAHYLLTKIYIQPNDRAKMYFAFMQMQTINKYQNRYMNSRLFEKLKLENSSLLSRFRAPRHWTEEQKNKVRGKSKPPFSSSHRQNISKAIRGLKQTPEIVNNRVRKTNKPVRCLDTGEIFSSVKAAAENKKVPASHITIVCKGRGKSTKGLHWEYAGAQR